MGRINPNDYENYVNNSQSSWFKLADDGDHARVQFLYDNYDDLDIYACHEVEIDGNKRYVNCPRDYDSPIDDCPLCAEHTPVKPVMILQMYDLDSQSVKLWQRGPSFKKKLDALFNRYPELSTKVFEIERNGKRGDVHTTYEVYRSDDTPVDVSSVEKVNLLGGVILDKSVEDMNVYLDTGSFPPEESNPRGSIDGSNRREETVSRRRSPASRRGTM